MSGDQKALSVQFVFVLLMLGIAAIFPAAKAGQNQSPGQRPLRELLQYVHEARGQGIAEDKIKKQALVVGWPEAAIEEAIAYEKNGGPPPAPVTDVRQAAPPPKTPPAYSNALPTAGSVPPATVPPEKTAPFTADVGGMTAPKISDDYLIARGDTLQISVWKEPEASVPNEVVRPDGKIALPMIKEVEVAGLTPLQAEALITQKIGRFIADPNVTVVVSAIHSQKIYLIGAVKKEGGIPYTYGITVMQALSEAGGLTDYAKRTKIYILRTESGRQIRLGFNYQEVLRGQRMEQNIVLLAGDTVIIPQ